MPQPYGVYGRIRTGLLPAGRFGYPCRCHTSVARGWSDGHRFRLGCMSGGKRTMKVEETASAMGERVSKALLVGKAVLTPGTKDGRLLYKGSGAAAGHWYGCRSRHFCYRWRLPLCAVRLSARCWRACRGFVGLQSPHGYGGPLTVRIDRLARGVYGAGGFVELSRPGVPFQIPVSLQNSGDEPLSGTLRLAVIDSWKAEPAAPVPFQLGPRRRARFEFTVTVGPRRTTRTIRCTRMPNSGTGAGSWWRIRC